MRYSGIALLLAQSSLAAPFFLNSGVTSAVKANRVLGGEAAGRPKWPREHKGYPTGYPTDIQWRYKGDAPG